MHRDPCVTGPRDPHCHHGTSALQVHYVIYLFLGPVSSPQHGSSRDVPAQQPPSWHKEPEPPDLPLGGLQLAPSKAYASARSCSSGLILHRLVRTSRGQNRPAEQPRQSIQPASRTPLTGRGCFAMAIADTTALIAKSNQALTPLRVGEKKVTHKNSWFKKRRRRKQITALCRGSTCTHLRVRCIHAHLLFLYQQ